MLTLFFFFKYRAKGGTCLFPHPPGWRPCLQRFKQGGRNVNQIIFLERPRWRELHMGCTEPMKGPDVRYGTSPPIVPVCLPSDGILRQY
jgi:hypothetical protein